MLTDNEIKQDFSKSGRIQNLYRILDYIIVEYQDEIKTYFAVYVNKKLTNELYDTIEEAMVGAVAYKYEGPQSQALKYFFKMVK